MKLLEAASEAVGGNKALALRLGISPTLLSKFMADSHELPDVLLLRAVDIILEDRQSRLLTSAGPPALQHSAGRRLVEGD
ncbi:MAG TPA: hypothetical protein VHG88_06850 [Burkholderiales bacterium]|nr:hypothetical protein [Burkholderiales bacterium]